MIGLKLPALENPTGAAVFSGMLAAATGSSIRSVFDGKRYSVAISTLLNLRR